MLLDIPAPVLTGQRRLVLLAEVFALPKVRAKNEAYDRELKRLRDIRYREKNRTKIAQKKKLWAQQNQEKIKQYRETEKTKKHLNAARYKRYRLRKRAALRDKAAHRG